jgi:hypothetical protein
MEQEGRGPAVSEKDKKAGSGDKKDEKGGHEEKQDTSNDSGKPGIGTKIKAALHKG